jgi:hypothetical protein
LNVALRSNRHQGYALQDWTSLSASRVAEIGLRQTIYNTRVSIYEQQTLVGFHNYVAP